MILGSKVDDQPELFDSARTIQRKALKKLNISEQMETVMRYMNGGLETTAKRISKLAKMNILSAGRAMCDLRKAGMLEWVTRIVPKTGVEKIVRWDGGGMCRITEKGKRHMAEVYKLEIDILKAKVTE